MYDLNAIKIVRKEIVFRVHGKDNSMKRLIKKLIEKYEYSNSFYFLSLFLPLVNCF